MGINAERLWNRFEQLASITDPDHPYTRRSFTELFLQGRAWLAGEFAAAGLDVTLDAGANLVGRRAGSDPSLAPIAAGSHSDTVPDGGRFDGIAGVLVALEVAQALAEDGVILRHPLEVIDFLSEEPSEFGVSCVGSRAVVGTLSETMLGALGPGGETLADGIRRMGGDPAQSGGPLRQPGDIAAYFELHIEQGRVLEGRNLPIGVVTHIAGLHRGRFTLTGRADHAGNTPMALRQDALVGASKVIQFIDSRAAEFADGPTFLVATVGRLDVEPNASNVVPGRAEFFIDVRCDSDAVMGDFIDEVNAFARQAAEPTRLDVAYEIINTVSPAPCAEIVQEALRQACARTGNAHMAIASGAGHDAMHIAAITPMGMIFIPCLDGRSHCAEEWTEPGQVAAGARVMYEAVKEIDGKVG